MIRINRKDITDVNIGTVAIQAVRKGARLVWRWTEGILTAVKSCFGTGRWRGDKTWKSNDIWRNN